MASSACLWPESDSRTVRERRNPGGQADLRERSRVKCKHVKFGIHIRQLSENENEFCF